LDVGRAGPARRDRAVRWLVAGAAALVPIAGWLVRNRLVVGNWSGEAFKAAFMTMSPRPLAAWPDHPLFGVRGWLAFLPHLAANFWTGEFSWLGEALTRPWIDRVYATTTGIAVGLAAVAFWRNRSRTVAHRLDGLALVAVFAGVATLAALSMAFDLQTANFSTPWSAFPYFASGRLIAWILVPFGLVLVRGIGFGCAALPLRLRNVAAWSLLIALLVFATAIDVALARPVFASRYNWFHLDGTDARAAARAD
jgi:hypothetical protein